MMESRELPVFDVNDPNVGKSWISWVRSFTLFIEAKGISSYKRKKASLLHYAGVDV